MSGLPADVPGNRFSSDPAVITPAVNVPPRTGVPPASAARLFELDALPLPPTPVPHAPSPRASPAPAAPTSSCLRVTCRGLVPPTGCGPCALLRDVIVLSNPLIHVRALRLPGEGDRMSGTLLWVPPLAPMMLLESLRTSRGEPRYRPERWLPRQRISGAATHPAG